MTFHNPGLDNVDFMVAKKLPAWAGTSAVFRAEFFNLFNHTNFSNVDNSLTSPGFGRSPQLRIRASSNWD